MTKIKNGNPAPAISLVSGKLPGVIVAGLRTARSGLAFKPDTYLRVQPAGAL